MTGGNSVVGIKVYGRRDAAVPFAASLLALMVCVNVGFFAFGVFVWVAFILWGAFTALISFDFWESRCITVDRGGKTVRLGRRRLPFPDIKSVERTGVSGYADLVSLRRVKVKVEMRDGSVVYFPLPFTPSIADRADRLVAELKKHVKA